MATFAERLVEQRRAKRLSQAELGERVNLEQSEISRLERAKRPPSLEIIKRFAEFFNVSLDYMAGREAQNGKQALPPGATPLLPTVLLPVLGTIRAGQPILATEEVIGWESADMETVRNGEHFYLKVKGDSMIGDHIVPGALVLVRMQEDVTPQEIAVVIVNGDEATLKRRRIVGDKALLIPSNPAEQVQEYHVDDVRVIGKVIEAKIKF